VEYKEKWTARWIRQWTYKLRGWQLEGKKRRKAEEQCGSSFSLPSLYGGVYTHGLLYIDLVLFP
jgi:hypothetical protein